MSAAAGGTVVPLPGPLERLARQIAENHAEIERQVAVSEQAARKSVDLARETGRLLNEAKTLVPHGGWMAWVAENCPFAHSTANLYMKIDAEWPRLAEILTVRNSLTLREVAGILYGGGPEPDPEWVLAPEPLADHLRRIRCRGRVRGAVFDGGLRVGAISGDQHLIVLAPALPGAEDVRLADGALALPRLDTLVRVLERAGAETVRVGAGEDRLVVDDGHRLHRLRGAPFHRLENWLPPSAAERAREAVARFVDEAPHAGTVTPSVKRDVWELRRLRKWTAAVEVDEDGGVSLFLGGRGPWTALLPLAGAGREREAVAEPFRVRLTGALVDVVLTVDPGAEVFACGPEHPVVIRDGAYHYALRPWTSRSEG